MKEFKISIPEYARDIFALPGTTLFECLARAGIVLRTPCGGQGICGKCLVIVSQGNVPPSEACKKFFSSDEIEKGYRLACETKLFSDATVLIPQESLFEKEIFYLGVDAGKEIALKKPAIAKIYFELDPPTLDNPLADLENLQSVLGRKLKVDISILAELPVFLRKNDFRGTAAVSGTHLISLERGNTVSANFAVAVDLGTTSIVASLVNLHRGAIIATKGIMNPQAKFGDDVISRISAQSESPQTLEDLKNCVIAAINGLIEEFCDEKEILPENIYHISVAGNTAMELLICGIPAEQLGTLPFVPPFKRALSFRASSLGFEIHPLAEAHFFPVIGGFVGGDIVAGLLACDIRSKSGKILFIDVGTNGEIVFSDNGKLYAGAAAAGPAFEGARIKHGMRAASGAIEKIIIENGQLFYNVIRNTEPIGICGTALIDIVAELLQIGIIDKSGRILSPEEIPDSVPCQIKKRLYPGANNGSWDFLISENSNGKKIFLTQSDVRELQLASGAIRAATNIILKKAGSSPQELDLILIAGTFGNFIRRKNAKHIGLIPDIPDSKILYVGNTSAVGAASVLFSSEKMEEADRLAESIQYVEVSQDDSFQDEFALSMLFP